MLLRRARLRDWETPLILLGVVLLSYGLWIPWMGLFGNDVPYLWYYHLLGPWGPGEFASIDRPASALFYALVTFVLGETVWPYHVFLLLLRWLSAVLLWWVLGLVWPERKRETALAALLFAVYPGFRQNPVALEFILHFFVLDMFLLSLGTMLVAACRMLSGAGLKSGATAGLLAVSAASMGSLFFLEYFIGLEVLRPLLLWLVLSRAGVRGRRRWRALLIAWAPALLMALAFLVWRVFIFSFNTYRPVLIDQLRANPLAALVGLAQTVLRDSWTALGAAWLQTLSLPAGRRSLLVYGALALASAALVAVLWWRVRPARHSSTEPGMFGETLLGIGLLSMLAGGSIFWLTGIPVTVTFPWDRSTLSLMLGASLVLAGALQMAVTPRYRPLAAAALLALAVGMHFVNAQEYRAEWRKLQDFTWQLTWRVPQLRPGTLMLFDVIPLNRYSDNDLTALLNWTYAPELRDRHIPYKFFDLTIRLGSQHSGLPGLEKDLPVEHNHRGVYFSSTTSHMLAVHYNPPGCLRILSAEDAVLPNLPERLVQVLPLSQLDQVDVSGSPVRPPRQMGDPQDQDWCYYFEKADLARQRGDWQSVAGLGDQAFAAGWSPADRSELLVFIQGYALTEQMEQAAQLSEQVSRQAELLPALCDTWQGIKKAGGLPAPSQAGWSCPAQ